MPNSILLGVFWMALAATKCSAAEVEPAYRRWAVLATKSAEEKGLADLLIAELASRNDLELVERQKLSEVAKELELSACLGADAGEKRLKLGQLLGAEAIVFLSLEEREKQSSASQPPGSIEKAEPRQFLRAVISECRYGVRLKLQHLPYADDQREPLVRTCGQLVDETRRQYAGGIRQVIGVTHFLSKNLLHDYDHLQAGYAYLLETSFTSYPGVAVVETEEARAIGRELEIANEGLKDRVMPLFLEGEYTMTVAKPGSEPTVRLSLRATDGKQTRWETQKQGLSLAEATDFLRETAPREIVRLAQGNAAFGVDRKQQFELLAKRADVLARYEGYEHAIGLREAALLLEPNDLEQRLSLVGDRIDASRIQRLRFGERWETERQFDRIERLLASEGQPGQPKKPPEWQEYQAAGTRVLEEHIGQMHALAGHLDYLVRRRLLNPQEATWIAAKVLHFMLNWSEDLPPNRRTEIHRVCRETAWRIYPLFPQLDPRLRDDRLSPTVCRVAGIISSRPLGRLPVSPPLAHYDAWTGSACGFFSFNLPSFAAATEAYAVSVAGLKGPWDSEQVLGDLYRFLTEVASPEIPVPWMVTATIGKDFGSLNRAIEKGHLKAGEVRAFYERLKNTGQPLFGLYGRLGLLGMQLEGTVEQAPPSAILREIEELLTIVQRFDSGTREYEQIRSRYVRCFQGIRGGLADRPKDDSKVKRHTMPKNPIAETDAATEVVFEPIDGQRPWWDGLRKCSDTMDVAWSNMTVDVIENRVIRQVFPPRPQAPTAMQPGRVGSVSWDGKNLWIACSRGGIYVVSPRGEAIGRVSSEQGLPPYAESGVGLKLHPVAPGKCLAFGNIGPFQRAWIAIVSESGPGEFETKILHSATKVPPHLMEPSDDPEEVFQVRWLNEIQPPWSSGKRLLLVGRTIAERKPLAIDLETFQVGLFPARMPTSLGPLYLAADGRVWKARPAETSSAAPACRFCAISRGWKD